MQVKDLSAIDPTHTITLDFETYYDREYSLSKITTAEYIKSPLFEVICVAIKVNDGKPQVIWGQEEIEIAFGDYEWSKALVIGHNLLFDAAILEWVFKRYPLGYYCTRFASRGVYQHLLRTVSLAKVAEHLGLPAKGGEVVRALGKHAKDFSHWEAHDYMEYCSHDANLSYEIARETMPQLPFEEHWLIDLNVKRFTRPLLALDAPVLEKALADVQQSKVDALKAAGIDDPAELRSKARFAEALRSLGVDPPTKPSLADPSKSTFAFAKTDKAMQALAEDPDPQVQALVAARLKHASTLEERRVERFISVAEAVPAAFPVPLIYCGARTYRYSGADKLNLQNLPRGSALRKAIIPRPEGSVIIAGDLSQIEARILACLAGQDDLVEVFRRGDDPYKSFIANAMSMRIEDVTPEIRMLGKIAVLGLGYGMGADKFADTLRVWGQTVPRATSDLIHKGYRNQFTKIGNLWRRGNRALTLMIQGTHDDDEILSPCRVCSDQRIELPNGMSLHYPLIRYEAGKEIKYGTHTRYKIYGAKLIENIVQALARIVICGIEARLFKRKVMSSLQAHDELVYVAPERIAEPFSRLLYKEMVKPVPWMPQLPLEAEVNIGNNYAECK